MEKIKIINKSTLLGKEIDVWGTIENPLFKAKDVAEWIEHSNIASMMEMLDEDEKVVRNVYTPGGNQNIWMITEDGLYEVLMRSRKKRAKQFKKGVKTILHEIRTKGGYIATQQNDTPEMIMARALKVADETIKRNEERLKALEAENEQQSVMIEQKNEQIKKAAPKVEYYDNTLNSSDTMTTTQVADTLGITARKLNTLLSDNRIIYKQSGQWHLHMPYKGWNLASVRTHLYAKTEDKFGTSLQLVWNQRGKRFIIALFNNNFNVRSAVKEIRGEMQAASLAISQTKVDIYNI